MPPTSSNPTWDTEQALWRTVPVRELFAGVTLAARLPGRELIFKGQWLSGVTVGLKVLVSSGLNSSHCAYKACLYSQQLRHPNITQTYSVQCACVTAELLEEVVPQPVTAAAACGCTQQLTGDGGVPGSPTSSLHSGWARLHEQALLETNDTIRSTDSSMMSSVASLAGQCAARLSFTSGSSVCLACSSSENLVAHQQQGGSEACGAVNQGSKALRLPNACSEPALHMALIAESCCAAAPGTVECDDDDDDDAASFTSGDGYGEPTALNRWAADVHSPAHALAQWRKVAAHTQLCVGDHVTLLVTEWADCGSLSRAIACGVYSTCPGQSMQQSSSRRRYRALLRTARDVAQGLDHLHAEGITHGDIRPGSVLLRGCRADARGFTARLTNLCRAQHTHSGDLPLPLPASHHHYSHLRPAAAQLHPLPPTQDARGPAPHPLRYSAPEAVRGQLQPASDVWSWAVVVWHMASGQLPFDGLTEEEVTQGVAAGQLRLVWPAGVSPALAQLVQQCLQPAPRLRPSAAFLVAALVAEELEVRRAASSGSQQRPRWHHNQRQFLSTSGKPKPQRRQYRANPELWKPTPLLLKQRSSPCTIKSMPSFYPTWDTEQVRPLKPSKPIQLQTPACSSLLSRLWWVSQEMWRTVPVRELFAGVTLAARLPGRELIFKGQWLSGVTVGLKVLVSSGLNSSHCAYKACLYSQQLRHPNITQTYSVQCACVTAELLEEVVPQPVTAAAACGCTQQLTGDGGVPGSPTSSLHSGWARLHDQALLETNGTIRSTDSSMMSSVASLAGQCAARLSFTSGSSVCLACSSSENLVAHQQQGGSEACGAVNHGAKALRLPNACSEPALHMASIAESCCAAAPGTVECDDDDDDDAASFTSGDGYGEPTALNRWAADVHSPAHALAQWRKVAAHTQLCVGDHVTLLVTEWADCGSLSRAIACGVYSTCPGQSMQQSSSRRRYRALLRTARDVAQGLDHLHAEGITHGDIRPGSVLLRGCRADARGFTARLTNLCRAQHTHSGDLPLPLPASHHHYSHLRPAAAQQHPLPPTQDTRGPFPHSLRYSAPEAVRGQLQPASDVWSWAVVVWHMASGQPPFDGLTEAAAGLACRVSPALAQLVQQCLQPDPRLRPSAAFLVAALVAEELEPCDTAASLTRDTGIEVCARRLAGTCPYRLEAFNIAGETMRWEMWRTVPVRELFAGVTLAARLPGRELIFKGQWLSGVTVGLKVLVSSGLNSSHCAYKACLYSQQLRHPNITQTYSVQCACVTAELLEEVVPQPVTAAAACGCTQQLTGDGGVPGSPTSSLHSGWARLHDQALLETNGTIRSTDSSMMSSVASLAGQCAARLSFTSGSSVCLACSSSENLVAHQQQGGSEACGAVNHGAKALRLPNACSEPALHMASIAESCCAAAPGTVECDDDDDDDDDAASFTSGDGYGEPTALNRWAADVHSPAHALAQWRKVAAHTQLCVGDHVTLLVTEWADCGSLSRAIACGVYSTCPGQSMQQSSSRRRYRALLRTARDVAQGLDHLHAEGITHGDIRPGSVLLRGCRADARGFTARLTNLCRAQHTHSGDLPLPLPASHHHYSHLRPAAAQQHPLPPTQDTRGPFPHPLRYSAPEAVRGQLQPASDVWSWAVVVWHMASGQPPFDGLTEDEVTQGVAAGQLRLVWPAGVSPALAQLVQQCLQPAPRLRPSAAFLVAALVAEELEPCDTAASLNRDTGIEVCARRLAGTCPYRLEAFNIAGETMRWRTKPLSVTKLGAKHCGRCPSNQRQFRSTSGKPKPQRRQYRANPELWKPTPLLLKQRSSPCTIKSMPSFYPTWDTEQVRPLKPSKPIQLQIPACSSLLSRLWWVSQEMWRTVPVRELFAGVTLAARLPGRELIFKGQWLSDVTVGLKVLVSSGLNSSHCAYKACLYSQQLRHPNITQTYSVQCACVTAELLEEVVPQPVTAAAACGCTQQLTGDGGVPGSPTSSLHSGWARLHDQALLETNGTIRSTDSSMMSSVASLAGQCAARLSFTSGSSVCLACSSSENLVAHQQQGGSEACGAVNQGAKALRLPNACSEPALHMASIAESCCAAAPGTVECDDDGDDDAASFTSGDGYGEPTALNRWAADVHSPAHALAQWRKVAAHTQLCVGDHVTLLVTEWADCGSLSRAIACGVYSTCPGQSMQQSSSRRRYRALLRTARDVAQGLDHLHAEGITHGDIRPGSVLLRGCRADARGFTARLTNLCRAQHTHSGDLPLPLPASHHHYSHLRPAAAQLHPLPPTQDARGPAPHPLRYSAPEAVRGQLQPASDVWSWAVVVWHMASGQLPFDGLTEEEVTQGVAAGQLRLVWPAGVSPALAQLVQQCLQPDPRLRPSAAFLVAALVAEELEVRRAASSGSQQRPRWHHNQRQFRSTSGKPKPQRRQYRANPELWKPTPLLLKQRSSPCTIKSMPSFYPTWDTEQVRPLKPSKPIQLQTPACSSLLSRLLWVSQALWRTVPVRELFAGVTLAARLPGRELIFKGQAGCQAERNRGVAGQHVLRDCGSPIRSPSACLPSGVMGRTLPSGAVPRLGLAMAATAISCTPALTPGCRPMAVRRDCGPKSASKQRPEQQPLRLQSVPLQPAAAPPQHHAGGHPAACTHINQLQRAAAAAPLPSAGGCLMWLLPACCLHLPVQTYSVQCACVTAELLEEVVPQPVTAAAACGCTQQLTGDGGVPGSPTSSLHSGWARLHDQALLETNGTIRSTDSSMMSCVASLAGQCTARLSFTSGSSACLACSSSENLVAHQQQGGSEACGPFHQGAKALRLANACSEPALHMASIAESCCAAAPGTVECDDDDDDDAASFTSGDGYGEPTALNRWAADVHSPAHALAQWRKVAAHTQLCVGDHVTLLVTEWADCGSLSRAIACGVYSTCPGQSMQQSSSRRRYRALLRTARDVAQGLDHLHAEGITHGNVMNTADIPGQDFTVCVRNSLPRAAGVTQDIRPGSVLLRGCRADARGFTARLTNLCRAQHTHSVDLPLPLPASHHHYSHLRPAAAQQHPLPPTQAARGPAPHPLRYSAPEAVRGQLQPASDVWSWAVVVWHMASGQLPFDGLTEEEVTQGVAAGQLRLVWPAGVSPALAQLVQQCLQPDPRLRPSAAFLVAALVAEELEVRRAASSGSQQRPRWHQ
ncbi:hypothetical protein QJQ45_017179 [Haematococcus lacustris]|nr:hypothetical protein QJQ45_017179 [Haematococcus lacustris]